MAHNILLIPKGFLGDVLLTTPVLSALARGLPGARITVVCTPKTAEFVQRDPLVHRVLVYDRHGAHQGWRGLRAFASAIRAENFDIAYSFHSSLRTGLVLWMAGVSRRVGFGGALASLLYTRRVRRIGGTHDVIRNLALVESDIEGATREDIQALLVNPSADVAWSDLRVPQVNESVLGSKVIDVVRSGERYCVVSPGSAWETKRWDASGYREVVGSLVSRGARAIIVGAREDSAVCQSVAEGTGAINLCGETSIEELIALIKSAECVVCNDSLALHICSATKTPAVVIFCATSPRFGFGPWRNKSVIVERRELFCKPCHRHGSRRCPNGTRLCMTGVSAAEVVRAVDTLLADPRGVREYKCLRVVES